MTIQYQQNGDYLIPALKMDTPPQEKVSKYGLLCKEYMKAYRTATYNALLLSGTLPSFLLEIDRTANREIEQTMKDLIRRDPPPDSDTLAWTRHMNTLLHQAEELILTDLIYNSN
ncbi:MAG: TnpV protein [Defluviitaleaceae bacterium]|nr:TnpV protein [Defluviitaleaceae bacterium]